MGGEKCVNDNTVHAETHRIYKIKYICTDISWCRDYMWQSNINFSKKKKSAELNWHVFVSHRIMLGHVWIVQCGKWTHSKVNNFNKRPTVENSLNCS